MVRITAPTPGFHGSIGDVQFTDSVAVTDDVAVIGYCQGARGYAVEFDDVTPAYPEGLPAKAWTVAQLTAWASEHDIDLGGATKKDDIVALVVPVETVKPADPPSASVPPES